MFCKNCGKKLDKDEIFCGQCGNRIVIREEKKGKAGLVMSIVAIVLSVSVVITSAVLFFFGESGRETATSVETTTAQPTQQVQVTAIPTTEPTEQPQKSVSSEIVTGQMKKELEPLMKETTYFFALMGDAGYVEDTNLARTMMVYYNLQYRDDSIDYTEKETIAKPKVEEEMWNLFGENAEYELEYRDTFPGYLYIKEDGYVRYNGGDWGEGIPHGKTLSVVSTGDGQYRLVRHVGVKSMDTGEVFWSKKITCDIVKKPSAKYGYYIAGFRDYRKGDSQPD